VTPFRVQLRPGVPVFEQIVYAAKRAIVSGQLRAGDPFPSVRTLSREQHINPNTAHKVIATLLAEGLLESHPGVGTVVASPQSSTLQARRELLVRQVEPLVVEAKHLGLSREDILEAISNHWERLSRHSQETTPELTYTTGDTEP
jgi:GntR family transcriptional regulator